MSSTSSRASLQRSLPSCSSYRTASVVGMPNAAYKEEGDQMVDRLMHQQQHWFRGDEPCGSNSPLCWQHRLAYCYFERFVPRMSQQELDFVTCLNGILFLCLEPSFKAMMSWDRRNTRPGRSVSLKQFLSKGIQSGMYKSLYHVRGPMACYTQPYRWLSGEAVNLAVYETLHGLCDAKDKRNLVPLYRVLGPRHRFETASLAYRVAVKFMGAQAHLEQCVQTHTM